MKGLIVAGAATLVGVAGVVGLSAATDGGTVPTAATSTVQSATTDAPVSLDDRLRRLDRAQRAADAALTRTAPAAPVASLKRRGDGSIDDSARSEHAEDDDRGDDGHRGRGGDDDRGDDHGHGRGRGRGGDDD